MRLQCIQIALCSFHIAVWNHCHKHHVKRGHGEAEQSKQSLTGANAPNIFLSLTFEYNTWTIFINFNSFYAGCYTWGYQSIWVNISMSQPQSLVLDATTDCQHMLRKWVAESQACSAEVKVGEWRSLARKEIRTVTAFPIRGRKLSWGCSRRGPRYSKELLNNMPAIRRAKLGVHHLMFMWRSCLGCPFMTFELGGQNIKRK